MRCSTAATTTRIPKRCAARSRSRPASNVRIDISGDYARDDAHLNVGQPLNSLTFLVGGGTALALPTNPTTYDFTGRTTPSLPNSTRLRHYGGSVNASVDLTDALTLRSITAYRELHTDDYVDIDATQLQIGDVFVGVDQNQFSQEFQGNYNSGPVQAVAGLYYLREHIISHQEAYANNLVGPLLGNPTFLRTIDDDLVTKSYAAYANVSVELAPGLRLVRRRPLHQRAQGLFPHHLDLLVEPAADQRRRRSSSTRPTPGTISRRWARSTIRSAPMR